MNVPRYLLRHRITVEPYLGDSAYGQKYGPPVEDVPALVGETIRLVRDREGRQVTSTAQIIAEPGLDCPAESRITLPDGRITKAIAVAHHTAPGLPVPQCTEVSAE
ncbi:head-to-tail stopper [Streptomyces phage Darolandstone]|uniref:Head-to-tail stopper n=1 Tax=Streptomyces phage Darolandstone TaxID=2315716 RepID=A0A386KL99_9CAUD|nr:head-tail connector protein [Streptomyces phage Darolandstone]AYD86202.1 head-to-tail stopper [Streptomyces phage Darolandstone]